MNHAEILFKDALLMDVETGQTSPGDLAVAEGKILALGPNLQALIGPHTQRINLQGKLLLPGFTDAHLHFNWG